MNNDKYGIFCEVYGCTLKNLAWEHFLTCSETTAGDMAKDIGISRPKAYQIISEFEKRNYIKKGKIFGKTHLYSLNKDNSIVKIYKRNFNECLKMVVDEYKTKKSIKIQATSRTGSAKA